ncbi:E3 ubiquitin/ISG15 ligase TRIM25-like L homeolog [Xenopus laevis]|uniref:E3 ubiquitin/ISG15 ligase TRIM25-like L homeolog n=2 Tax=Xenopus laevis TaxID=8355 RepID=A0A8J0PUJ5_XENLA|nr:E3 ubiquitin/ISG15 ligase TRIM25-like L homeolog [Xenopus laevis]
MAAAADLRDELNCSVCLTIYSDPVMLPCGHNFCQGCIVQVLDTQEATGGVYTCPECRAQYMERPALQRNRTLGNIAERFFCAQPEPDGTGIFCTYCIHSPVPAAKSCLLCEASLCESHVRVHSRSAEHVLTTPTAALEMRKCSVHREPLKYYCYVDSSCICASCCLAGQHKRHRVELLSDASEKKKEKLRKVLLNLPLMIEEAERGGWRLQERRREVQEQAAAETERVVALFVDIRERLEALEQRVLREVARQEEELSLQVSELIQQLEVKKEELSRKILQTEELCNMADPLAVLQAGESDRAEDDGGREGSDPKVLTVGDLDKDLISETLHSGLDSIVTVAKGWGVYGKGATHIRLDIDTASNNVAVSEDRRTASWTSANQLRPQTPSRFIGYQVLSNNSFTSGQYFWDMEVSESGSWRVGVAYPSIGRKGNQFWIGNNIKSWCLWRWNNGYSVRHDSHGTDLPQVPSCTRIRISLDYQAGRLSFYELGEPITHLHTFTASFTEPLHAAFWVWKDTLRGHSLVKVIS